MIAVRLLPVVLSLMLLGAHFFRAGSPELTAGVAAVLALLLVRRPWAVRVVQVVLVLGAIEWLMTLGQLVFERAYSGQPVVRLVLILAGVAMMTALSTLVFQAERVRLAYGFPGREGSPEPPAASGLGQWPD